MYDTIIIGNDVSSLVAALTTVRRGRKTAWIREGTIPDVYAESGYIFNIDPFPWSGFGHEQRFRQFLAAMDIPLADRTTLYPLHPSLQIVFQKHRLDLFSGIKFQLQEIQREFFVDTDGFEKFFDSVIKNSSIMADLIRENPYIIPRTLQESFKLMFNTPALLWHRKNLSRRYKALQKPVSMKTIIDAEILLLSNLQTGIEPPFAVAYALASLLNTFYYVMGGKHNLMIECERKFQALGGTLLKGCSVLRLNINEDIKADIIADDKAMTIVGHDVIISSKWEKFKPIILDDKRFSKYAKKYMTIENSTYPFTIHMGLHDKGLPEKFAPYVMIIFDEEKPLKNNNLVFLETSLRNDTERAPIGRRALSATVFLDDSPLRLNDEKLTYVTAGILKNIEKIFPFFMENLDFINIEKSIDISRKYQEILNLKYSLKRNSIFGVAPLTNKTPVKNVYVTGGMLLAGLGFEGELISGLNAANLVSGDG
jgi:phytoene dehydrogenase-like protein